MVHKATTPPLWLKVWHSTRQAAAMPSAIAMQKTVEMHVARKCGVALTRRCRVPSNEPAEPARVRPR